MKIRLALLVVAVLSLAACASPVPQRAARLKPENSCQGIYIAGETSIALSTGYHCRIKPGTRWLLVGNLDQGQVYRPLDQVLNVEGQHVDEAYLVVSSGKIIGFYLPARGAFAPAADPVELVAAQPLAQSHNPPCAK